MPSIPSMIDGKTHDRSGSRSQLLTRSHSRAEFGLTGHGSFLASKCGRPLTSGNSWKALVTAKDSSEKWINCLDAPVCEAVARRGPKWGPGVFV